VNTAVGWWHIIVVDLLPFLTCSQHLFALQLVDNSGAGKKRLIVKGSLS